MARLRKEKKAEKLIDEDSIIYIGVGLHRHHFIVRGTKKKYYEVDKETRCEKWYCNCDNVLFTKQPCAHILACAEILKKQYNR